MVECIQQILWHLLLRQWGCPFLIGTKEVIISVYIVIYFKKFNFVEKVWSLDEFIGKIAPCNIIN